MSKAKISLERAALVAEIVSAIAVVVSIIYLANEVSENTNAVRVQTAQSLLDLQFEYSSWKQNAKHVELLARGNQEPDALSEVEWQQYSADKTLSFNLWEQALYSFANNDLSTDQWESWDRSFNGSLCNKGTMLFWERGKYGWTEAFQAHINRLIEACSD